MPTTHLRHCLEQLTDSRGPHVNEDGHDRIDPLFDPASEIEDRVSLAIEKQHGSHVILKKRGIENVETIQATERDPKVPAGVADWALIVDAYHEFSHPREVIVALREGLRPGGRLYLLEYRAEDPTVPIKRLHKMSEAQARREIEAAGLRWVETLHFLPRQHVLVFERPTGKP